MLHITCALKHEAGPLAEYFQLQHDGGVRNFPVYSNSDTGITLITSGPGMTSMESATRFAADYHRAGSTDCWLNIGIAGHASLPAGTPVLANHVYCSVSGQSWNPGRFTGISIQMLPLRTVPVPSSDYREDQMFDMEAAGFCAVAAAVSTLDRLYCLKVISDNRLQSIHGISAGSVRKLVTRNLPLIGSLVDRLQGHPAATANDLNARDLKSTA